jgi:ubiquinone/menaquinone biosynthesis C-methylase UbiE
MQHMPTKEVVIKNIEEMSRVLKNGGLYKIDPPIGARSKFKEMIIPKMVRFVPPLIGHYKLKLTPTYRGVVSLRKRCRQFYRVTI